MGKVRENFIRYWLTYLISFIIGLILGSVIFLLWFYLKSRTLYDAVNGSTLSFVVLLAFGLLALVGNFGMFDGIVYGFKQMFTGMFSKTPNKYTDYPGYVQEKRAKRSGGAKVYLSLIASSLVWGIVLLILEIIYHI